MKEKLQSVYATLKDTLGTKNPMQAPRITKVVLGTGIGKVSDKARLKLIRERLALIAGQQVSDRRAKQSIASFKLREGDIVGYAVTLRGKHMYNFLDKLIHVALPNTRDFQGLKNTSVDAMGNYSLGITEHTIFPECHQDELKDIFSFGITIVTTAKSKEDTLALLRHIGLPLQK